MNNNIKYFFLLLIFTQGCKKFIEVGPPQDQLVTESVFASNETATSAMTGLYVNMMTIGPTPYTIALNTGLYSDELDYKLTDVSTLSVYKNTLISKDSPTNSFWINGYKYIYHANSIIEGLNNSANVTEAVKKQLIGEALFIRAFWNFYLVNLYGDMPLVTTTDYTINSKIGRQPINTIYDQIVADLIESKSLLSEKYAAANSVSETNIRVRPNKYVASALLARVYLFRQDWNLAEAEATIVMNNSAYVMENIVTVFKATSKEAIWQLQMPTPIANPTFEANFFILANKPAGSILRSTTISPNLLAKFDNNDLRKINWIGSFIDKSINPNVEYSFPYKYKTISTVSIDEHSICFRLAEMYLIRAEARAQQNKLAGAIDDVDVVRGRAGISLIKTTNPGISNTFLLDIIMDERQKEFFCEYGHRWFDLKRTNRINAIMSIVTLQKGGIWSSNWVVWPLPQNDLDNNKKLIQNDGYN
jgi:hypothetical protein